MPQGLHRYQHEGDDHFITFSCHHRPPYLNTPASKTLFLQSLEATRKKYHLQVFGYVLMPEHVHLLLTEPDQKRLSTAIQALKLSVSKLSQPRPFWLARYHDRNIFTHEARVRVLRYMHRNPVARGLVEHPEDWPGPPTASTPTTNPPPSNHHPVAVTQADVCPTFGTASPCLRWACYHRVRNAKKEQKAFTKPSRHTGDRQLTLYPRQTCTPNTSSS